MKKKKLLPTFTRSELSTGFFASFFSFLILSALAYIKISPQSQAEFVYTCDKIPSPNCFSWFETTRPYFQKLTIGSLILALLCLSAALFFHFRKK